MSFIKLFRLEIKWKIVLKLFIVVFVSLSFLLILSCGFSGEKVKNNIIKSAYLMENEGEYPSPFMTNSYYKLDNWTEATILNFIFSDYDEDILRTAFAQKQVGGIYNGKAAETGLECLMAAVGEEAGGGWARPAYWIGVRSILIPLLNFFDYYQIRLILMIMSYVILFLTLVIMGKKNNAGLAMVLGVSLLLVNIYPAMMNISLGMFCFWISFLGVIYVLYHRNINHFYLLFTIGMLTAYFEWFALSLITFGVLTTVIVVLEFENNMQISFGKLFNIKVKCAVGWCLGFIMMYVGRMICGGMIIGKSAFEAFKERALDNTGISVQGMNAVPFSERVLQANINCITGVFPLSILDIGKLGVVILALLVIVATLVAFFVRKEKRNLIVSLVLIGLSPYLWISCFSKYSIVHYWIIYRVVIITVFAFMCILYYSFLDNHK